MTEGNSFSAQDGPRLLREGTPMAKRRNPVYLERQSEAFTVETNEGVLRGNAGDYLAHDPISGHVWSVSEDYVSAHYEPF